MGLKFESKKFKFGMRTLKTGIAVFLVLGLFSALGWEGLQIGCLTAVFSLREKTLIEVFSLVSHVFLRIQLEVFYRFYSIL